MGLSVIILAAGKGTRMRSSRPKVLHTIAHRPMVSHVIDAAKSVGADNIYLVYGFGGEQLKAEITDTSLHWVLQSEQLGTGHAVQQVAPLLSENDDVLILYGDVPLTSTSTLNALIQSKPDKGLSVLTVSLDDPTGYGRILRDDGQVVGIREHKDATDDERNIQEVNTGIMIASGAELKQWLSALSNDNAQKEYYLTDIVGMANTQSLAIHSIQATNPMEVEGANNRQQLAALEREYQKIQAEKLMLEGATLLDPNRIDVRGEVIVGEDVLIDVNCIFEGKVTLGNGVQVGANSILKDCSIGDNTLIKPNSMIESSIVGESCTLGPFARLRPDSKMMNNSHVGNFVEMKKSTLGEGSKANHLTYLGDSVVESSVNIGAGTITCNYDGANKHQTIIKKGAFIGSNSALVAPITVGEGSTVGAGSTVSKDIEDHVLVVARGKTATITNWKRPVKKSKE